MPSLVGSEMCIRDRNQCRYINRFGHYPVYRNTDVIFYPDAAEGLAAQLHDLASAEHFIFMEYHAIEEAEAFGRIRDVLAERAAHGAVSYTHLTLPTIYSV